MSSSVAKDTNNARVSPVRIDADLLERVRIAAFKSDPRLTIKQFVENAVRLALPVRGAR